MKDITWRAHVDRPPSSKVDFLPPRTTLAGGGIYGGHSLTGISTFYDGWVGWAPRALSRYNMRSSPKSTVIAQKLIFLPPRTTLIDTISRISSVTSAHSIHAYNIINNYLHFFFKKMYLHGIHPSIYAPIYQSIHLSMHPSINPSIYTHMERRRGAHRIDELGEV